MTGGGDQPLPQPVSSQEPSTYKEDEVQRRQSGEFTVQRPSSPLEMAIDESPAVTLSGRDPSNVSDLCSDESERRLQHSPVLSEKDTGSVDDDRTTSNGTRSSAPSNPVPADLTLPSRAAVPEVPNLAPCDSSMPLVSPFSPSEDVDTCSHVPSVPSESNSPHTTPVEMGGTGLTSKTAFLESPRPYLRGEPIKGPTQEIHFLSSLPSSDNSERPGLSVSTVPSLPASPTESTRPLTPPFPNDIDVPRIVKRPVSPRRTSSDFGMQTDQCTLSEKRRYSSGVLSMTRDAEGLFPLIPFPERPRYSLVDPGPLPGLGDGRRTISDVGQNPSFTSPQRRRRALHDHSDTDSASSSRAPSRPSTARYSTFAEMGIQSFVMSKGAKAVDMSKKDKKRKDSGKAGKRKLVRDAPKWTTDEAREEESDRDTQKEAARLDIKSDDVALPEQSMPKVTGKRQNPKSTGCIIM